MKNILHKMAIGTLLCVISFSLTGVVSAADTTFPWKTDWSQTTYFQNTQGGTVKARSAIRVTAVKGPIYKVSYGVRIENIPASDPGKEYIYQAWLLDSETGWRISLGSTIRKANGIGETSFSQYFANPKVFDKMEITQEKLFDQSPAPENSIVYSTDLNIPALTELGYKTTFSPKNLVPAGATSNKSGSGKFIINVRNNTMKYRLDLKNMPYEGRTIRLYGPARAGANAPMVMELENPKVNSPVTGEWSYDQLLEEKLMNGEYYIVIGNNLNNEQQFVRGQITF